VRETVSRKGAAGPLRLNPDDAAIAADVIEKRTEGVDLERTPLAALPAFGRKLGKAVRRRRTNVTEIVMWTVDRNEAEAGYRYLMLFSHEEVPSHFLTLAEMDAVHNVALDILSSLLARTGPKKLDADQIQRRIRAWDVPETSDVDVLDPKWIHRLKQRVARENAFWQQAHGARRPPIPPSVLALMAPRKITGN